jgi:hypothetical protein
MRVTEVLGLERVGGAVSRLIRLWKCVEKREDERSSTPKKRNPRKISAFGMNGRPIVISFHESKCGAAKLTNSRALTTLVAFQNLGKWRKFPVIR